MQYSLQLCDCCMYLCIQFLSKFAFHRFTLKNEMEMQKQKKFVQLCSDFILEDTGTNMYSYRIFTYTFHTVAQVL